MAQLKKKFLLTPDISVSSTEEKSYKEFLYSLFWLVEKFPPHVCLQIQIQI